MTGCISLLRRRSSGSRSASSTVPAVCAKSKLTEPGGHGSVLLARALERLPASKGVDHVKRESEAVPPSGPASPEGGGREGPRGRERDARCSHIARVEAVGAAGHRDDATARQATGRVAAESGWPGRRHQEPDHRGHPGWGQADPRGGEGRHDPRCRHRRLGADRAALLRRGLRQPGRPCQDARDERCGRGAEGDGRRVQAAGPEVHGTGRAGRQPAVQGAPAGLARYGTAWRRHRSGRSGQVLVPAAAAHPFAAITAHRRGRPGYGAAGRAALGRLPWQAD